MFLKQHEKEYNIIDICFDKGIKIFYHDINLTLYINWWVFKTHNDHVELLLITINYSRLFMFILFFYSSLIKIVLNIHDWNMTTACHCSNDVCLCKHKIDICVNYLI